MLGIIDYDAGNGHSVMNACTWLGLPARMCGAPEDLDGLSGIVLPGVGSAAATMRSLADRGLDGPLTRLVQDEQLPFLGICVGLQVMFETSAESDATCFGWLKGHVERLDDTAVRVPHMGWNSVSLHAEHPLLDELPDAGHFYFVHGFHAVPDDEATVIGSTAYPGKITSIVASHNKLGVQFHAEKSSTLGLLLVRNFARIAGC